MRLLQTRMSGFLVGCIVAALAVALLVNFSLSEEPSQASHSTTTADDTLPATTTPNTDSDQNLPNLGSQPTENANPNGKLEQSIDEETPSSTPQSLEAVEPPESEQQASLLANPPSIVSTPENEATKLSKLENFWGPFLSQSRARKFADYIEKIIERPMEIDHGEKGYSIGFKYETEEEKLGIKQDIQSKAGIDLGI